MPRKESVLVGFCEMFVMQIPFYALTSGFLTAAAF